MTSCFCKAAIVLNYYTNTTAFAKKCENKASPQMHCNGKCQMMKKLKQEEKKDGEDPERKIENKNEVLSCRSFFTTQLLFEQAVHLCYKDLTIEKTVDKNYMLLRPPAVV